MLEPDDVVSAVVAAYRLCPEIVAEMNGDFARIRGYRDCIEHNDLRTAILQLGAPGLLVVYEGDALRRVDGGNCRVYNLSVYFRGRATGKDESPSGTGHLRYLFERAIPTGSSEPLRAYTIHPSCYEQDPTTAARETVVISTQGDVIEYWRARLTLPEVGDE